MQSLRFNPFNQIHKGLRALLYHTSLQLQQCNYTNAEQTDAALEQVKEVLVLFEEHAEVEDGRIFPLIKEFAPALVDNFEQQHVTDHQLSESVARAMAALEEAATPTEKIIAGVQLQLAFQEFTAFNISHMNAEEKEINPVLWQHYSDEALQQKQREVAATVPPKINERYAYWMLKGLATHEIIAWFSIAQKTAPTSVWEGLKQTAKKALSPALLLEVESALESSKAEPAQV